MRWIDAEAQQRVPFDVQLALCRESAARWPHDAMMHARLGDVLLSLTKYDEAAEVFARARTLDGGGLRALELARCYLYLNRADDALQICDEALASSPHPDISNFHELRGRALGSLHRPDDASDAFLAAMRTSSRAYSAASALLVRLAHDPDDSRLLAFCEALPADYYNCSVARGFRAVGLSRVGRVDEAQKLVDLERHIWQVPFEPPQEFGGIENFNAVLAKEILDNPGLGRIGTYDFLRTQQLGLARERAYAAITVFMRAAFEKYLEDIPRRGLDEIMPSTPTEGILFTGANVVREGDSHLAHLHKYAYVSGVYHVSVPRDDGGGDGRPGALLVGPWSRTAGGHEPCWGRRYINPVAGVATIFPSHFFHSVVPTRGAELRIAIAFDLNPIGRRSEKED
jgi:tetratricopeptide (TPR) repeat protein